MSELTENFLKMAAVIVSLGTAIKILFSTLNYDSFDRKLMPKNKSSITFLKQITGRFVLMNLVYVFFSYLITFFVLQISIYADIGYILIGFFIIIYMLTYLIIFLEWLVLKLLGARLIQYLQKLEPLFKFNKKWHYHIILCGTLSYTTIVSDIHLTQTSAAFLSKAMLNEVLIVAIIISLITTIQLSPIYVNIQKYKYQLLPLIKSEAELLEELGTREIFLEYFLNESIIIYSASDHEYKIIKRIHEESPPIYEVYKLKNTKTIA